MEFDQTSKLTFFNNGNPHTTIYQRIFNVAISLPTVFFVFGFKTGLKSDKSYVETHIEIVIQYILYIFYDWFPRALCSSLNVSRVTEKLPKIALLSLSSVSLVNQIKARWSLFFLWLILKSHWKSPKSYCLFFLYLQRHSEVSEIES